LTERWRWLVTLFSFYVRHFVARHFHAVRLTRDTVPVELGPGPVIFALNHPSWWDPMVAMLLARQLGDRVHVAPIDEAALERYRFFRRLGLFGVEPNSFRGLRQLQAVGQEVLRRRDGALWITPQGAFSDVRRRPLRFRPGIGVLARLLREGTIVPVAIEYPFWTERLPEALVRFGRPIRVADGRALSAREWTDLVEQQLGITQDELAELAMARDPRSFQVLLAGRTGVTWIYDLWRRLVAWWRAEPFRAEHGPEGAR
jgi:1-acyl-sn-glycerol-3-phosphate acyltransferase